jgi:hypothetical protein
MCQKKKKEKHAEYLLDVNGPTSVGDMSLVTSFSGIGLASVGLTNSKFVTIPCVAGRKRYSRRQ